MGKVPNYFKSAQKELLSLGGKLIDKMKEYDKDNIPTKIIDKIGPYIEMEAFTPAQVQKASKACTAMCMWVRAMHKYHQVSVMVEPKKKLLAEATAELEETMQKLARSAASMTCPSHDAGGRFFVDFELFRTPSSLRVREAAVASMA